MSKMIRFFLRRRYQNTDREQTREASKRKEINEPNATLKKLTDMDDDCLENIFVYLSLEDLLSVVHTNKHLKTAAELVFVRNFGRGKFVVIINHTICKKIWTKKLIIRTWINETEKVELPNPYRLLRCFGHLISKLFIYVGPIMSKPCSYEMAKYVNKYCRESTTEIFLDYFGKYFYRVNKPYPNVETVSLTACHLKSIFRTSIQLNKLFPNVRNLSIVNCEFKRKYIAVHFPQLNQLKIENSYDSYEFGYAYGELFRLNPQIRSLNLSCNWVRLVELASHYLEFLEHLELTYFDDYSSVFGVVFVDFPSLKEIKIRCLDENSKKIEISASSLEAFSFELCDGRLNVNNVLDFLNKQRNITKFNLTAGPKHLETTNYIQFPIDVIGALPFLEEVNISLLTISVNDAIRFVANCKSLKKFCFKTDYNVNVNHLKARAGAKYHVVCTKVNELKMYKLYRITIVDNCHSTV